MHATSRIPAAIDALVAVLGSAIGTTVNVVDGPPLDWQDIQLATDAVSEHSYLFIGADPDTATSADGTQDFNAAGAVSRDEVFTIYNTALVWAGDLNIKQRRDDAFALVAAVEEAIRADPSLGDAVLYSRMSGVTAATQSLNDRGSTCVVTFTVAARAYLD